MTLLVRGEVEEEEDHHLEVVAAAVLAFVVHLGDLPQAMNAMAALVSS